MALGWVVMLVAMMAPMLIGSIYHIYIIPLKRGGYVRLRFLWLGTLYFG